MKNLSKLLSLKSIITILLTFTLCFMTFAGRLTAEHFLPVVTMVLTYYFTRKEKGGKGDE